MSAQSVFGWSIGRVLAWAASDLRARGFDSPRLDAELLLGHALGCDRVRLVIDAERPLIAQELAAYRALHRRRRRGEPVAYLRGQREFFGRRFAVDRRVLIPRPDTETLVEVGLERSRGRSLGARVLDLCTGSGCVAITLAKERPTTEVLAADICLDALDVARYNALRLGALVGLVRADVYQGLEPYRGRFDLITANPPYIPEPQMAELSEGIRAFEPTLALSAGPDGMSVIRRIATGAPAMLTSGGVLALEVLAGTAAVVTELLAQAGLVDLQVARDGAGHERVVSGRYNGPPRDAQPDLGCAQTFTRSPSGG